MESGVLLSGGGSLSEVQRAAEAQAIRAALEQCNGNRLAAARLLGLHKSTLFRNIRALGIPLPERTVAADGKAVGKTRSLSDAGA